MTGMIRERKREISREKRAKRLVGFGELGASGKLVLGGDYGRRVGGGGWGLRSPFYQRKLRNAGRLTKSKKKVTIEGKMSHKNDKGP